MIFYSNTDVNLMSVIEKGLVIDSNVDINTYSSIEHDDLNIITSIVLHRTASSSADGTLNAYKNGQTTGAHFLIDKSGQIIQTANLNKTCWHVGILLPRCQAEKSCSKKDLKTINSLLHEKGLSFSRRAKNLSRYEAQKSYPSRFPSNSDYIGIEVVGLFLKNKDIFEDPSQNQITSLKWLVNTLTDEYSLNIRKDIYAHGVIARKEASEGAQLLKHLISGS